MESLAQEHMQRKDNMRGSSWYVRGIWRFAKEAPVIRKNWDAVLLFQRQAGSPLIDRISRKIDEIGSLRDGVSPVILNSIQRNTNPLVSVIQRTVSQRRRRGPRLSR
jgi:hypothetical protein